MGSNPNDMLYFSLSANNLENVNVFTATMTSSDLDISWALYKKEQLTSLFTAASSPGVASFNLPNEEAVIED